MQVIVHVKLVGADCSAPCRMAFPPQELLWLFRYEPVDIGLSMSDNSEGLPYKLVGDRNDRQFTRLAVRSQTVETGLTFGITSE